MKRLPRFQEKAISPFNLRPAFDEHILFAIMRASRDMDICTAQPACSRQLSASDTQKHWNANQCSNNSDAQSGAVFGTPDMVQSEWTSHSDPGNPRNWSLASRIFHTAIPAMSSFVVIFATSVYVPAIPYVQGEFHATNMEAILGLSLYLFGVAIGSTLGGPISELAGRKIVYQLSLPILIGFNVASASSDSLSLLVVCRLIAGLGGSLCISVGGGTITDLWDMETTGIIASLLYVLMPFLAPALGPLTGAYIIEDKNDWRWSLWIVAILGYPIYFLTSFMQETFKDKILRDRNNTVCPSTEGTTGSSACTLIWIAISRTMSMLLLEPLVMTLAVYTSFAFAIIFIFFDIFPSAFSMTYSFNDRSSGLTFLSLFIGFVFAVLNFGILTQLNAKRRVNGSSCLEDSMYSAMIGSVMLPGSLFWLAFACNKNLHWIVPVSAGVVFGWSTLNIFLSALLYVMGSYPPKHTASAISALGVLRYSFGAIFPLFATEMFEHLGIQWTCVLLGGVASVMIPVPFVLFRYGPNIRQRSRFNANQGQDTGAA